MKFKSLHFLVITIFFGISPTFAQNTTDAAKDLKLQLSFAGGKPVDRIGEPVKLSLSYTATQPDYVVERYYSPRFDDVILSPTDGIYDWLYRLNRLYSDDDVSVPEKLSASPVNIEITINNL